MMGLVHQHPEALDACDKSAVVPMGMQLKKLWRRKTPITSPWLSDPIHTFSNDAYYNNERPAASEVTYGGH